MLRDRPPDRPLEPGAGAEVSREAGAAALAAFRREQPFGWQDEAVQQLAAMDDRYGRVLRRARLRRAAERPGRVPAGSTPPTASPRSTRSARSSAAAAAGTRAPRCSPRPTRPRRRAATPVFLVTDAADWPQQLYRRLGFDPIGATYEFLKLPLGVEPSMIAR